MKKRSVRIKKRSIVVVLFSAVLITLILIGFSFYAYKTQKYYWFNKFYYNNFTEYRQYQLYKAERFPYIREEIDENNLNYVSSAAKIVSTLKFKEYRPVVKSIDTEGNELIGIFVNSNGVPYEIKFIELDSLQEAVDMSNLQGTQPTILVGTVTDYTDYDEAIECRDSDRETNCVYILAQSVKNFKNQDMYNLIPIQVISNE